MLIKKSVLLEECKKLGLENYSTLKKDELIKLLETNGVKININCK